MRVVHLLQALAIVLLTACAQGAGFAHNDNFVVLAPDQSLAAEVLNKANVFRKQIAEEWLGEELPPGIGEALIHVTLSATEDNGLAWPIDDPGRKLHKVWLTTSREGAVGSTLYHEIVHLVMATQFPDRLPAWAEEGIASLSDDPQRAQIRERVLGWYSRTGNWPDLAGILQYPAVAHSDKAAYSVAVSVTEYLLSRADKATFLRFAQAGKREGWDRALEHHYRIASVRDLQGAWQTWASHGPQTLTRPSTTPRQEAATKAEPRL